MTCINMCLCVALLMQTPYDTGCLPWQRGLMWILRFLYAASQASSSVVSSGAGSSSQPKQLVLAGECQLAFWAGTGFLVYTHVEELTVATCRCTLYVVTALAWWCWHIFRNYGSGLNIIAFDFSEVSAVALWIRLFQSGFKYSICLFLITGVSR